MKSKSKKIAVIIAVVISLVLSFTFGYTARNLTLDSDLKNAFNLLEKYRKYYYFDDGDVVTGIENALLDKYSTFYSKEEYESVKRQAKGESIGIGVAVNAGTTYISSISLNSPCDKAGVKAGGNIVEVKVDGEFKSITTFDEFKAVIDVTSVGYPVVFKVDYLNGEVREYSVIKDKYTASYVTYCDNSGTYGFSDVTGEMKLAIKDSSLSIKNNSVGYIKYTQFNGTKSGLEGSAGQIKEVLKLFKQNGKTKLILDLRGNGGGYMNILCDVASHFINVENGKTALVSVAVDKYGNRQEFTSSKCDYHDYGFQKIVIMCDEGTASASEALIGAMLDYDISNIVSVVVSSSIQNEETVYKSYGKGIMQSTYLNVDGSAVKLTTAGIFWPVSNITIHEVGITTAISNKVVNAQKETALETALSLMN